MTDPQRRLMAYIDRIMNDPRPVRIRQRSHPPLGIDLMALGRLAERAKRAADEIEATIPRATIHMDSDPACRVTKIAEASRVPPPSLSWEGQLRNLPMKPWDIAGAEERHRRAVGARRHATLKGRIDVDRT